MSWGISIMSSSRLGSGVIVISEAAFFYGIPQSAVELCYDLFLNIIIMVYCYIAQKFYGAA